VKLRPGTSAIVSLRPRGRSGPKLAVAKKVLVKETVAIGASKRNFSRELTIVQ